MAERDDNWPTLRYEVRDEALRQANSAVSLFEADHESGNFGDDPEQLMQDVRTLAELIVRVRNPFEGLREADCDSSKAP